MKSSASRIAILSGIFTSMGFAPHLLFMLVLFFVGLPVPFQFLVLTYPCCIILGEYLFYQTTIKNLSFGEWLKYALHPTNPGYFFWAYFSEILFDGIFLYLALKFQWDPLCFFLVLIGCKFVFAPIQTHLSHLFLSKNISFVLAVPTQILCLFMGDKSPELFLCALILRGILCNGIPVARSQFVEELSSQDA